VSKKMGRCVLPSDAESERATEEAGGVFAILSFYTWSSSRKQTIATIFVVGITESGRGKCLDGRLPDPKSNSFAKTQGNLPPCLGRGHGLARYLTEIEEVVTAHGVKRSANCESRNESKAPFFKRMRERTDDSWT